MWSSHTKRPALSLSHTHTYRTKPALSHTQRPALSYTDASPHTYTDASPLTYIDASLLTYIDASPLIYVVGPRFYIEISNNTKLHILLSSTFFLLSNFPLLVFSWIFFPTWAIKFRLLKPIVIYLYLPCLISYSWHKKHRAAPSWISFRTSRLFIYYLLFIIYNYERHCTNQ